MFSSDQVVLGMDRADFLNIYGQPFSKDQRYVNGRRLEERLLYKEERKFLNPGDKENEKK